MTLCVDCEYPIAGDVSALDELPQSWRPPYGSWIPNGPRTHFRVCDACNSVWAVRVEPELGTLEARLLDASDPSLFELDSSIVLHLRSLAKESDPQLRTALGDLLEARIEHGEPDDDLNAFIAWLTGEGRGSDEIRAVLPFFGQLVRRVTEDPHLERARAERPGAKRELFEARIDRGHGLAEAARLAERDWVAASKVVSLPTVRGLDLTALVALHREATGDTALHDALGRTLSVFATAALRPPARVTVTPESRRALAGYLSD